MNCPVCNKEMKDLQPVDDQHPKYRCTCKYKWFYDKETKIGKWIGNKYPTSIFENQIPYIESMRKASPLLNKQVNPEQHSPEPNEINAIASSPEYLALKIAGDVFSGTGTDCKKVLESATAYKDWLLKNGKSKTTDQIVKEQFPNAEKVEQVVFPMTKPQETHINNIIAHNKLDIDSVILNALGYAKEYIKINKQEADIIIKYLSNKIAGK